MDRVDLLGDTGSALVIEYKGKKYRLARVTHRMVSQWELYLRQRALSQIKELSVMLSDERTVLEIESYKSDVNEGKYRYEGDLSRKVMESLEGRIALLDILLREYQPNITAEEMYDLILHKREDIEKALAAASSGTSPVGKGEVTP